LIWRRIAWAWLVIITSLNVYRAATASCTIDEARVFNDYIDGPFSAYFTRFDWSNHYLYTLICRGIVAVLGRAEIIQRLPSLIAGLFYFAAAWRLAQRIAGEGWRFLLALILLTSHPLILDHFALARGYGLALALFAWAIVFLLRALDRGDARDVARGACLLSFSLAANLSGVFPAGALITVFALVWISRRGAQASILIDRLLLPAAVPVFLIAIIPVVRAERDMSYFGERTLADSLASLAGMPNAAYGAAALALLLACVWFFTRGTDSRVHDALTLAAGAGVLAFATFAIAHRIAGFPYPSTRYGLLLIWLALVAILAGWRCLPAQVQLAPAATLAVLAIFFISQFKIAYYREFPDDLELKQAVRFLRSAHDSQIQRARVAVSWEYESGLNYYRRAWRLRWMDPVDRQPPAPGYDYYVLRAADARIATTLGLQPIWIGPKSGIVVASGSGTRSK
jgi:hypothetical protein